MKKYTKPDQKALATWAAHCAQRVLPLFEQAYPDDLRPRQAIAACRTWVRTGIFKMADIRGASLASHAAARNAKENKNAPACFAARAAGQAVATAHVPQHALGSAYYALKALAASDPAHAPTKLAQERTYQSRRFPKSLSKDVLNKITIQTKASRTLIKLHKGLDF